MGRARAKLTLSNPRRADLRPIEIEALVDTGADYLCLTSEIASQLELEEDSRRSVTLADGQSVRAAYVGPVRVQFENRSCFAGALVIGSGVLLGAIPMEDMDVLVSPKLRRLIANPENPDVAGGIAMGFQSNYQA